MKVKIFATGDSCCNEGEKDKYLSLGFEIDYKYDLEVGEDNRYSMRHPDVDMDAFEMLDFIKKHGECVVSVNDDAVNIKIYDVYRE